MKYSKFNLFFVVFLCLPLSLWAASGKSKLPESISVNSENQLDFLDIGENFGKRSVICRVSTAEAGTVKAKKSALMWSSFFRDELRLKKKRRNARRNGNKKQAGKLRKKLKNTQNANSDFSSICFQAITDLGVTPRPSPTPGSGGGNNGGGNNGGGNNNGGGGGSGFPSPSPSASPSPGIEFPGASFVPVRINGGGPTDFLQTPKYTDSQGNVWENDSFFSGVHNYFHAKVPVTGTNDQEIWMSERYGPAFSYQIPVLPSPNRYIVVLHLGEIFWTQPGQRSFDVYIENQQMIFDLDLLASVGFNTPSVQTYEVTVSDGVVNIDFFGVTQYAKVNAIEVLGHPTQYAPLF